MFSSAITISIIILGIHTAFSDGYVFSKARLNLETMLDWLAGPKISAYIMSPLFDCYVCMSSFWTIIFVGLEFGFIHLVMMIFMVCGLNWIVQNLFMTEDEGIADS